VSTEHEQQPHQTEQGLGYDGDYVEDPSPKSSSGLIRAGIFGVVLFLAVIGMASVINNWFRGGSSEVEEKLAVIEATSATGQQTQFGCQSIQYRNTDHGRKANCRTL